MANILEALIYASERAANVARSCCSEHGPENLLVAEKCEGEANARFERDFKTIADVLAQESARCEIASRCPELAEHYRGEECAEIGGVTVKLQKTVEQTNALLCSLVPPESAQKMSEAAHGDVRFSFQLTADLPSLNPSDLGVWIDPIDATTEFIKGVKGKANAEDGLPCVTVLIGAYLRSTGEPVMGVINQPFYDDGKGRVIWGVSYGDTKKWSDGVTSISTNSKTVLMSAAENPEMVDKYKQCGWEVKFLPGAGHKLMKVVLGEAAAYIVTKATTFRWDTCAAHAILQARGGDILSYTSFNPLTYNDPLNIDTQEYCNSGGIIAFAEPNVLSQINSTLD